MLYYQWNWGRLSPFGCDRFVHVRMARCDDIERKADPAVTDPGLPEAQINSTGEVVIAGRRSAARDRIEALRELRGDNRALALHLRPELSLAQVKGVLADARKSGANKIAVIARAPQYPRFTKIEHDGRTLMLDVLIADAPLDAVWATRMRVDFADATVEGTLCVVSRDALITLKLAAGRPQDLVDVQRLQEVARGEADT